MITMVTRKSPPPMPAPTMASIESSRTRSDDGKGYRGRSDADDHFWSSFFLSFEIYLWCHC